ncbi:hypothetical protein C500_11115 [Natrialba magadii ATCC 43099]|nr:hypothetical protein C500_11115 [Natrialba magadii ATCC 43099]
MAALLILSVVALPGAVIAAEPAANDSDAGLEIDVSQDESVTVTVTDNETTVDKMNLTVKPVNESQSYAAAGTYTNVSGEQTFDAPEGNESIEVEFAAAVGNDSVSTTETLIGDKVKDDEPEHSSFGSLVSAFVADQQNETDGSIGQAVSSFVTENNPGNAADDAGPPAHAGPGGDDEKSSQGPPAHAGPDNADDDGDDANSSSQGPPAHAGPATDADSDEDGDDDDDDADSNDSTNSSSGPPAHANGSGNGNN